MKLFLVAILAASLATIAVNEVTAEKVAPTGEVFSTPGAVIMTGEIAQSQKRGTFSTYSTTDRSARLAHLSELNAPPPSPPAPSTVVIMNQTTSVEVERGRRGHRRGDMRVDRRIHDRRQRTPRQYYPTPVPSFGIPSHDRRER